MQIADLSFVTKDHPNAQKVAVLSAPYQIDMQYAAIPEPSDEEIRIKIIYVGICGSDVETYRGLRKPEFMTFPARLGHEVSGVIDKVAKAFQLRNNTEQGTSIHVLIDCAAPDQ